VFDPFDLTELAVRYSELQALLVFPLLPAGFRNRDLRQLASELLGRGPDPLSAGQLTDDLRRRRHHGLIDRLPGTHRYRVSDLGLRQALFLTRVHDRVELPPGARTPPVWGQ
jgi:hypothetical protein